MEHNQETSIQPMNASLNQFGVMYENNFVVLDDAKHVIGVHPSNGNYLILENIENGSTVEFGGKFDFGFCITTLVYDEKTGFLYTGHTAGYINKYKIDTENKIRQRVKNYGDLGIDQIISSHRFLDFVFFGENESKIRVLNLSTGELVPGDLETSISEIYSLQVCEKSNDEIYLAVSGWNTGFSKNIIDLFDLTNLFPKNFFIQKNFAKENVNKCEENILHLQSTVKSQEETIKKLLQNRDLLRAKYNEMTLKDYDLIESKEEEMW